MNAIRYTQSGKRLAEMRSQWMCWSALVDTSTWESTFFFQLLDERDREIAALKKALRKKCH